MPRHDQVVRQWKLLRRIERSSAGVSVNDVAEDDLAQQRAFYRDLEALQAAGFPLFSEDAAGQRRWRLTDGFRARPALPVALNEILALRSARSALAHFAQTPFFDGLESLITKLDACLSPTMAAFADKMDDAFVGDRFGHPDYAEHHDLIDTLSEACAQRLTVALTYRATRGEETTRQVDPYKLWLHRSVAYLVAYCHKRKAIRTFCLTRIAQASLTTRTFAVDPSFDFDAFVHDRFRIYADGHVTPIKLWFAPEVAPYVRERTWHPSQRLTPAENGAIVLTMTVDGLTEVASWLLSFGPRARVLEPAHFAEQVRTQLQAALACYGNDEKTCQRLTPDVRPVV